MRAGHAELGLSYGAHPRQAIDLFRPDQPDPTRPLVVIFHGGYWRSLEIASFSHWAAGANAHGFSVAIPEYRLCPEISVAAIIEDARAALRLLHRRFARPMVIVGHSAGGHLAGGMVATDWTRRDEIPPAHVRHGLAISGLFDLAPLAATSMNEQLRLDAESAKTVSPAFWPIPPGVHFDAFVGETESAEFLRQSRLVADRWRAAGAATRYEELPGANHFNASNPLADPKSRLVMALLDLCRGALA